jgi:hypothetical protein
MRIGRRGQHRERLRRVDLRRAHHRLQVETLLLGGLGEVDLEPLVAGDAREER